MAERRKPTAADPGEPQVSDLKRVTENLREMMESLRTDRDRHVPHAQPAGAGSAAPAPAAKAAPPPQPGPDAAELERRREAAELALAREGAARAAIERELGAKVAELEAENRRLSDEIVAAEERTTDLAQRYTALERLHAGLTRGESLAALQEIVINLVGSEELAVLELRGDRLVLVQSFGVDPEPWRDLPVRPGAMAHAAGGAIWIAGRDPAGPDDGELSACIPLQAGPRTIGVLAVFRLLGHRPGFGEADHAIFELLSTHAGLALHFRPASGEPA